MSSPGDPETAHRAGVDFVSEVMLETLDEPADAVITTSAGYPLDLTFYQAIKGVTAASHIVKPGGTDPAGRRPARRAPARRNSAACCRRSLSDGEFLERIARRPVDVDQWQLEKLALVTTNAASALVCARAGRSTAQNLGPRIRHGGRGRAGPGGLAPDAVMR